MSQFLADVHPSHLVAPSNSVDGAVQRARIAFFVDTFFGKVQPHFNAAVRAANKDEREAASEALVAAVAKDLEPLFAEWTGTGPFFGGSDKLTLVEVLTGSFLLRYLSFFSPDIGLLSAKLPALLDQTPKFKKWAEATVQQESVNYIFDAKVTADALKAKYGLTGN